MPWHRVLDGPRSCALGALQIGTTQARHRPDLRRQGRAHRHPRAGPARHRDPAREDRHRTRAQERASSDSVRPGRAGRRRHRGLRWRATPSAWRPSSPTTRLLVSGRWTRRARALRGRAGHVARPRPRHVSVRDVVEPASRRRVRRARHRADAHRRGRGVAKAYLTRVGDGPFPSEAEPAAAEALREAGGEFGAVTGRPRRCGWLDLVGLRYAARVNGFTEVVLTKLDVLSGVAGDPRLRRLPAARRAR